MSSRRSRSGGSADREDGQPVVEVLAEAPAPRPRRRGRGWSPRRRARRPCAAAVSPTRHDLALLEHAQELRLHRRRHLADLVEEDRAAARPPRRGPRWSCVAPVNAPRRWPKSSLSSSVSGSAAQLTATNGPSARALGAVDAARDQLLAGAGLALDQHRRSATRRRSPSAGTPRPSPALVPTISAKRSRRARSRRSAPTCARSRSSDAFTRA